MSKQKHHLNASFFLILLILISLFQIPYLLKDENSERFNSLPNSVQYIPNHDVILITSNAMLTTYCNGNGTTGEFGNPHIIKDYIIDANGNSYGIKITGVTLYFIIQNCTIYNAPSLFTGMGIDIRNSQNANITQNLLTNDFYGIYLNMVYNCTIKNNQFLDIMRGIQIESYSIYNNTIEDNSFENLSWGITIASSQNTLCRNNTIRNATYVGIYISSSKNCTLLENTLYNCSIHLVGTLEYSNSLNISTSNTVNGKIIYYYVNQTALTTANFLNAGQILLVNCSNSLIMNMQMGYLSGAIELHYSHWNIISSNIITQVSQWGIFLTNSTYNQIISNKIIYSDTHGIYLYNNDSHTALLNNNLSNIPDYSAIYLLNSNNLTVSNNRIQDSLLGITLSNVNFSQITDNNLLNNLDSGLKLSSSNNNTLKQNKFNANAKLGLLITSSSSNSIAQNSFISNGWSQANITGSSLYNKWDDGTKGNYWSDYHIRYPAAVAANGIWNLPYQINISSDQDLLPLVSPPDNIDPIISHPVDVSFVNGTTGQRIEWTISDPDVLSPMYNISCNGVSKETGTWISGKSIDISLDNLSVGNYTYTIEVTDGFGGKVLDIVQVSVVVNNTNNTETPKGIDGGNISVLILSMATGILIVIIRRKRQVKYTK